MDEIIQKLKDHALAHYETGGWDFLVETFEDEEIRNELVENGITTFDAAVVHFADYMSLLSSRRRDIMATAF